VEPHAPPGLRGRIIGSLAGKFRADSVGLAEIIASEPEGAGEVIARRRRGNDARQGF